MLDEGCVAVVEYKPSANMASSIVRARSRPSPPPRPFLHL